MKPTGHHSILPAVRPFAFLQFEIRNPKFTSVFLLLNSNFAIPNSKSEICFTSWLLTPGSRQALSLPALSELALSEVEWVEGLYALFYQRNSKVLSELEEINALSKLGLGR